MYTIKSDFSTRHWKQHTWKTGFEAKYNRVQNLSLTSPNGESNGLPGATRSDYLNFNPEGAAAWTRSWRESGVPFQLRTTDEFANLVSANFTYKFDTHF